MLTSSLNSFSIELIVELVLATVAEYLASSHEDNIQHTFKTGEREFLLFNLGLDVTYSKMQSSRH